MHRLHIVRYGNRLITVARFHFIDCLRNSVKRANQYAGKNDCQRNNANQHQIFQNHCLTTQHLHGTDNGIIGNTGQHYTYNGAGTVLRAIVVYNGSSHLYVAMILVIMGHALSPQTSNHFLGYNCLPLTDSVSILDHL